MARDEKSRFGSIYVVDIVVYLMNTLNLFYFSYRLYTVDKVMWRGSRATDSTGST